MTKRIITQDELKRLFHYDPMNGILTRLVTKSSNAKVGDVVGAQHSEGYMVVRIYDKLHFLHRIIWLYVHGEFPKNDIDHINHNRADNRLVNLRQATRSENHMNRSLLNTNTSGFTGVSWSTRDRRWCVFIGVNNKKSHLAVL